MLRSTCYRVLHPTLLRPSLYVLLVAAHSSFFKERWDTSQRRAIADSTASMQGLFSSQCDRGTLIIIDEAQRLYPTKPESREVEWASALWTAVKDMQSRYSAHDTNVRLLFLLTYPVRSTLLKTIHTEPS